MEILNSLKECRNCVASKLQSNLVSKCQKKKSRIEEIQTSHSPANSKKSPKSDTTNCLSDQVFSFSFQKLISDFALPLSNNSEKAGCLQVVGLRRSKKKK